MIIVPFSTETEFPRRIPLFIFVSVFFSFTFFSQENYKCSIFFAKDSFRLSGENELLIESFLAKGNISTSKAVSISLPDEMREEKRQLNSKRLGGVVNFLTEFGVKSIVKSERTGQEHERIELEFVDTKKRIYDKNDYLKIGKFSVAFDTIYSLNIKAEKNISEKNIIAGKDTLLIQQSEKSSHAEKIKDLRVKIISGSMSKNEVILLPNILFEGGTAKILRESNNTLEMLASVMKEKPSLKIKILGHICCAAKGRDGLNEETGRKNLSYARARAVYNYLVSKGVEKKRLKYKGMKASIKTGKGAHYDRRVEIKILEK